MANTLTGGLISEILALVSDRPEGVALSQSDLAKLSPELLRGDGSNRKFIRVNLPDGRKVIAIAPESGQQHSLREAFSVVKIGNHLYASGVPVPQIYAYDEEKGLVICEDLGDQQLHEFACNTDFSDEKSVTQLRKLYQKTLDVLLVMQIQGSESFNAEWCWDSPKYDKKLMLERESGYFLSAFWQGVLEKDIPKGLLDEFKMLSEAASRVSVNNFLHRDFQSRNVMVHKNHIRVIDFQGGRLGPLQYDLASLLIDPYAGLPVWFQDELYNYYVQKIGQLMSCNVQQFHRDYLALAIQRNLQIIGAFSHLSRVCDKPFFKVYITPALSSLLRLCKESTDPYLPVLTTTAKYAQEDYSAKSL